MIEVPDHVYVFYAYRLYFADKDIYMIRYFYHKIENIRLLIDIAVCYFQISCVSVVQFLTVASHSYVSIDIVYYIPIFYVYYLLVQFLKSFHFMKKYRVKEV